MQMAQGVVEMQIRAAKFLFTTPITRPTSIMRFFEWIGRISLRCRMYFSCHFLPSPYVPLFHLSIPSTVIF